MLLPSKGWNDSGLGVSAFIVVVSIGLLANGLLFLLLPSSVKLAGETAPKVEVMADKGTETDGEAASAVAAQSEEAAVPAMAAVSREVKEAWGYHEVQPGDSLYRIARLYGLTVEQLKAVNNLERSLIRPGQVLRVPLGRQRDYPVGLRLTELEVQWLAQMIHAEARGEPYLGQVAVGAVIINRIKSPLFPNSLREVLYQPGAFQPISDGSFYRYPSERAYRAALEALHGHDPTNGALFFFNPQQSTDRFMHARPAVVTIGRHRFMY